MSKQAEKEKIIDFKDYVPPKFSEIWDNSSKVVIMEDITGTKFQLKFALPTTTEILEFKKKFRYVSESDDRLRTDLVPAFKYICSKDTTIPNGLDPDILKWDSIGELVASFC